MMETSAPRNDRYASDRDRDGHYSLSTVNDQNYLRGPREADGDAGSGARASSRPLTPAGGRTSTSR
jgi:hypothetical protein